MEIRYSCITCHTHFELEKLEKPLCPICGETHIFKRCARDPVGGCHCALTVHDSAKLCQTCGQPICPECGDHSVVVLSRVTGYLQDLSGWNSGKRAEFRDRQRSDPLTGLQVDSGFR